MDRARHSVITYSLLLLSSLVFFANQFYFVHQPLVDPAGKSVCRYAADRTQTTQLEHALRITNQPQQNLAEVRQGQWWRLFGPALLQPTWSHWMTNLFVLFVIGFLLEPVIKKRYFFQVVFFSTLIGNLAQYYYYYNTSLRDPACFGGMSVIIYGLLGFMWLFAEMNPAARFGRVARFHWFHSLWRLDSSNIDECVRVETQLVRLLFIAGIAWMVLGWVNSSLNSANMAHTGGLLAGLLLAIVAAKLNPEQR